MPDEILQPVSVPLPKRIDYESVPVNGSLELYRGELKAQMGENETVNQGTVTLNLAGHPEVCFEMKHDLPFLSSGTGGSVSLTDYEGEPFSDFFMRQINHSTTPAENHFGGLFQEGGLLYHTYKSSGKHETLGKVEFALINFPFFLNGRAGEVGPASPEWSLYRIEFSFGKWKIAIEQFADAENKLREAKAIHGHALTHKCELRLADDKLFSSEEARKTLEALYWFLSFTAGRRIAFCLPTGLQYSDTVYWQEWNINSASKVHNYKNWFLPQMPSQSLTTSSLFYKVWQEQEKRDWLKATIGFYCVCNQGHAGIEFALTEVQTLLEMLCSVALMEENSLMSEASFEKLPATDRIRALRFWLNTPTAIPESLIELKAISKYLDAPEAITRIRNLIIHPTRKNRAERDKVSPLAIHDAWQLSLMYCELALLKLIGYSGAYNNRLGNPPMCIWSVTPWGTPPQP